MYVVYKITNKDNNKYYLGNTGNFKARKAAHLCHFKYNRHSNPEMQHDYNLGHNFEFVILHEFETKKDAYAKELWCIAKCINDPLCYNIDLAGDHITHNPRKELILNKLRSRVRSKEHSDKIRAILIARNKQPRSQEQREKWRRSSTGRKMPPKSPETLKRMADAQRGKKKSPETIAKQIAARLGSKRSDDTKRKMSMNNPRCQKIMIHGVVYHSYSVAARVLGVAVMTVRNRVLSKQPKFKDWVML